tara:strand:- start:45 stop:149 length:105 start_codon:yes stop_codon:yes gene_type:complete
MGFLALIGVSRLAERHSTELKVAINGMTTVKIRL